MTERAPTVQDARDLIAAEYVLGLTEPADLPQVEAFILRDPSFAAAVAAWRARLAPLDETVRPAAADERLWTAIEAALGEAPPAAVSEPAAAPAQEAESPAAPATEAAAPPPAGAPDVAPAPPRPVAPGRPGAVAKLWGSLAFWRFVGLSGAVAALALAAGLGVLMQRPNRQPALVAVLMTESNEAAAIVQAYPDGRADLTPLIDIPVPEGRAIEVWTLRDSSAGPRSVGLIQRLGRASLRLDGPPQPGQLFEMTLEPATGSPTGRPTGPVLNKGTAAAAL